MTRDPLPDVRVVRVHCIHLILALRLELVRAYQTAGVYLLVIMCLWFWFGTSNTRGQRISVSIDIDGAA